MVTSSRSRPLGLASGQCVPDTGSGPPVQVQARLAGSDRLGGQLQAVQHQVRRGPQQELVLAAGGLAFGAVGHYDLPASRGGRR